MSRYRPLVILTKFVLMVESLNLTTSPSVNLVSDRYTIPNELTFDDDLLTIRAIALLELPTISSPITAFVWTAAVLLNWNSSKDGLPVSTDS